MIIKYTIASVVIIGIAIFLIFNFQVTTTDTQKENQKNSTKLVKISDSKMPTLSNEAKPIALASTIEVMPNTTVSVDSIPITDEPITVSKSSNLGIIIVPYFEADDLQWHDIYSLADKYPNTIRYVIINPCSGPCSEPLSEQWQEVIHTLQLKKIKTLGYIYDNNQSYENIDYYMKSPKYPTDGIFFDNEGTVYDLENFKKFSDYVRSLGGIVYINPGYNYPHISEYLRTNAADVVNLYEFEVDKSEYINIDKKFGPEMISVILGNISSVNEMETHLHKLTSHGVGVVYIYEHSYQNIPSFFAEMIKIASTIQIESKN